MPAETPQQRVIVADDHPVFREGLRRIVQRVLPHAVIEEAGTMDEVLALAHQGPPPALFILDLLFPGQSMAAIGELRQTFKRSSLAVVSMVDNQKTVDEVMAAGADGFIGKAVAPDEMGAALAAILAGEFVVRYDHSQAGLDGGLDADPLYTQLTPRQQDVLRLIANGLSNKEIARELDISPFTVRIHVSSLLRVLGVSSRAAAAAWAAKMGL